MSFINNSLSASSDWYPRSSESGNPHTFLILRVECSDLVRISDKLFSKLELDFEMLTWISWISSWSFVAFRGDSRWSYSIVNTTENQQSCPSSVWLQNSDRSHLQYLRDCYQGSRQFSMLVRSGFNSVLEGLGFDQNLKSNQK